MDHFIPLCVPSINGNEWKYVKDCLDTAWVSSAGSYVDRFEEKIADYTSAQHCVACSSGTAALHVALRVVGVGPDDEVIVPTLTFIATANAVTYLGAKPVFMDCDEFYNIDAEKTIRFLEEETVFRDGITINRTTARRISALVPVHVYGNAAMLPELLSACRHRNIRIVEDATESLGTIYTQGELMGRHTGTIGDIGCFSFNGNKVITTGAGGMILTDSAEYAEQAQYLTTQAKDDEVSWVHNAVGYNFRLSNIQAALGVAQLEQLPDYLKIKKRNRQRYRSAISGIPGLCLGEVPNYADNNCWMYPLKIDRQHYGMDRDGLLKHLAGRGIQSRPVWLLNHRQKPYLDCQHYRIERAQELWERTLNLPCSVGLKDEELGRVVEILKHA
jgi:aminotransferase in exopolysaccharide biosynthesis